MILPLLVLGRASVNRMSSGRAREPISFDTHLRNSSLRASWLVAAFERDEGGDGLAFEIVGAADYGGSATLGWATRADSTSMVPRRWPLTLMTSSTRPMSQ